MTVTDLFCGAGGASEGLKQAGLTVVQAVNHDPLAIAAHEANHPDTAHFVEDITQLDAGRLLHTDVLWASLECTNFSNAKGGKPRDANSRSLADHMPRYIQAIQPDYFVVENVREFLAWGPLDVHGKPVSRTKGIDFLRWFAEVEALGYRGKWRLLNAADYGARTTRTRLFIVFVRQGLPSVHWPAATHSKGGKTDGTAAWLPVAPCLDLDTPGESIFTRKKPLSEKTLQRLLAGLMKYVGVVDPPAFLMQNNFDNAAAGIDAPGKTATTNGGNQFLVSYYGNGANVRHISQPAPATTTRDRQAAVQPWLMKYLSNPPSGKPNPGLAVTEPGPTATTQDRIALVQPEAFLMQYNSGADAARCLSTAGPANSVPTANRFGLVQPQPFIDQQYGNGKPASVGAPAGAITNSPKLNLVSPLGWVVRTDFNNVGTAFAEPAATLVASRRHPYVAQAFLFNPAWFGGVSAGSEPGPVVVARQDKAPLSVVQPFIYQAYTTESDSFGLNRPTRSVTCTGGNQFLVQSFGGPVASKVTSVQEPGRTTLASPNQALATPLPLEAVDSPACWAEQPGDGPMMRQIRFFCRHWFVADVRMRMLFVQELSRIQGFPEGYVLTGGQTNAKKQLGNAVEVRTAAALGGMLLAGKAVLV